MPLSYDQIAHPSVLRDALIEPSEDAHAGFAYHRIFGLPVAPEQGFVAGRAIDASGTPGVLSGSILVRSERDLYGASSDAPMVAKPIGSPRDVSERYPMAARPFELKQFDGKTRELIAHLENGVISSAQEEEYYAKMAASEVHQKLEKYCADFFQAIAADASAEKRGGWTEIDWQNDLTGAALGSSNTTLEVLQAAINQMKLSAKGKINAAYIPEGTMQKLQTDPQVLGRIVNGANFAVQGAASAPPEFVVEVLKQHLGFEEVIVASGCIDNANSGQNSANAYIWQGDRMWLGQSGEISMQVRANASPRVLSGTGAFCGLYTKLFDVGMKPDSNPIPQYMDFECESFFDAVSLVPGKGAIVHNLF